MKSMSSQIERRFEISSSIVGIIDGSFEIGMRSLKVDKFFSVTFTPKRNLFFVLALSPVDAGNLMVMVLVSYLGPRVHRPKIIAVGCLVMAVGAFLSVMPQFLMGR